MLPIVPETATERVRKYIQDFRIVLLNGPRRAGKTTLLSQFQADAGGTYRSLDSVEELRAALIDPVTYAQVDQRPLIIDEVQRAGDPLVLAIKRQVDTDRSRGQFLLSGSSHFLTVPTLSESLAGRMALVDLWPFSMAERTGSGLDLADLLLNRSNELVGVGSDWTRDDYLELICAGSFSEVLETHSAATRRTWFDGYLRTVISRDIQEFAGVEKIDALPRLLALIAARAGGGYVPADVARGLGVAHDTARRYTSYLETVFAVRQVPAWSSNVTARFTKTPKLYLTDSGLAAHVTGTTTANLRSPNSAMLGGLVETFVFTELLKHQSLTGNAFRICHYRDRDKREIDLICETPDGRVCAIEVKATASPRADDARHLAWLRDRLGASFVAGFVVHLGQQGVSYGDRIYSVPLSTLWANARTLDR